MEAKASLHNGFSYIKEMLARYHNFYLNKTLFDGTCSQDHYPMVFWKKYNNSITEEHEEKSKFEVN